MSLARVVQFLGLVIVTFVMVRSFVQEPSMLFQFGGLGLGAAVFLTGVGLGSRQEG